MKLGDFQRKFELLAEETGMHIGDGSMNFYANNGRNRGLFQLRGHISDDKEYYEDHIKTLYKELYGISVSIRRMPSTGVLGFQLWSDELVDFKGKLGLPLGKKGDIKIPEIFFTKKDTKTAIIRGIFDTDGCVYLERKRGKIYPRVEIRTISTPLAEQLMKIMTGLNIRATRYKTIRKNKNWRDVWCINVRGFTEVREFFTKVKPKNPKHLNKFSKLVSSYPPNDEADNRKVAGSNPARPTNIISLIKII